MVNSNRIINSPLSSAHNILSVGNKLQLCIHSETKISCDALGDRLFDPDLYFGILKYWFFSKFPLILWAG